MAKSVKRAHRLFGLAGPTEFISALKEEGVDLDELMTSCLVPGAEAGLLLAGSLAEGVGNKASDVDLLVLLDSRDDLSLGSDGFTLQAGRAVEKLVYRNGVEVNIEVFVRKDVERLMESFVSIAPALYDPKELKRIPMLQAYDLRFLHRLRTGWVLRGKKIVEVWRDEFMVDLLQTYVTVLYLIMFWEFAEDAGAMLKTSEDSAIYVGRMAIECALRSALASVGFTNPHHKWMIYWCKQAGSAIPSDMLQAGLRLLVGPVEREDAAPYIDEIGEFGELLLDWLNKDPEIARATSFLSEQISYVRER